MRLLRDRNESSDGTGGGTEKKKNEEEKGRIWKIKTTRHFTFVVYLGGGVVKYIIIRGMFEIESDGQYVRAVRKPS